MDITTVFGTVVPGSNPGGRTLNELKGSECEPKRNARRACQGFFGGNSGDFGDRPKTLPTFVLGTREKC